jgi:hypothetical protein
MEKRHENWDVQRMEWKAALEALGSGIFVTVTVLLET